MHARCSSGAVRADLRMHAQNIANGPQLRSRAALHPSAALLQVRTGATTTTIFAK